MTPKHAYTHCLRCGGRTEAKGNTFACSNCGFVYYLNPVFCNAVVILNDENKVLMVERKRDPKKGMLDLPGGFVDAYESFEQSVKREMLEELQIKVKITGIVGIYNDTYVFQEVEFPTIGCVVTAKILSGTPQPSDDAARIQYVGKDELKSSSIAFEAARTALLEYFSGRHFTLKTP